MSEIMQANGHSETKTAFANGESNNKEAPIADTLSEAAAVKAENHPEKENLERCSSAMSIDAPLEKQSTASAVQPEQEATAGVKRTSDTLMDVDQSEDDGPMKTRQRRRRTGSPAGTQPTCHEARRRTSRQTLHRSATQPRWHNQAYMLFLALRQHPNRCLSRPELIKAALALDEKISKERNLPRVFKGKTPMNSASASLTTNTDRYFIPFRPDGSRAMHFKLAYEPGDFSKAVQEYRKWEKKLIEHDWPYCFGVPIKKPEQGAKKEEQPKDEKMPSPAITTTDNNTPVMTEFDEFIASRNGTHKSNATTQSSTTNNTPTSSSPAADNNENDGSNKAALQKAVADRDTASADAEPVIDLADLDLSNVPKSWRDIVRVGESTIEGAGKGLFATRKLPYNTPLGFYFGVPMTEDEFDSLKDGVGRASEYSIMYRRTVLDATDDNGQPFTDPDGEMFCPFHFMNETSEKQANILFIEGAVVNQVICWTKRDIEEGEELFVWYGRDVDRHWSPSSSSSSTRSNASSVKNSVNNKKKQ